MDEAKVELKFDIGMGPQDSKVWVEIDGKPYTIKGLTRVQVDVKAGEYTKITLHATNRVGKFSRTLRPEPGETKKLLHLLERINS